MTAALQPVGAYAPLPTRDRAISHEAERLRGLFTEVRWLEESVVLSHARRELDEACWEALHDNWDGDGASGVQPGAYQRAVAFLQYLPRSLPSPTVAVDPDGEISFTWQRSPSSVFSVSVGSWNTLSYAGLFGGFSSYGTEYFTDELPPSILFNLARLYPRG